MNLSEFFVLFFYFSYVISINIYLVLSINIVVLKLIFSYESANPVKLWRVGTCHPK